MDFTAMDALAYRSLGADEYEQRRSEVIGLAKELPEDATVEQAEAIDAELNIIDAEDERRAKLARLRCVCQPTCEFKSHLSHHKGTES